MRPPLILRPEPGAGETARRARALGLEPIVAPLFEVRPIAWSAPVPAAYDAVMLTSANAARRGGDPLSPFLTLPCWAVGEASAEAALARGFVDVRTGPGDGAALLGIMVEAGVRTVFHPCGVDHLPLDHPPLRIDRIAVYDAQAARSLSPATLTALDADALALLHSPRAAHLFASLLGARRAEVRIAVLSEAVAQAAGKGWRSVAVAETSRDAALLELAAKLCQTAPD